MSEDQKYFEIADNAIRVYRQSMTLDMCPERIKPGLEVKILVSSVHTIYGSIEHGYDNPALIGISAVIDDDAQRADGKIGVDFIKAKIPWDVRKAMSYSGGYYHPKDLEVIDE